VSDPAPLAAPPGIHDEIAMLKPTGSNTLQLRTAPKLSPARGDDDLMSQPPTPGEDADPWRKKVAAALTTWDRLTESEIRQTGGRIQKLADLVQKRYDVPLVEAENQVMRFFDKQTG
jgi:hypothetical protein